MCFMGIFPKTHLEDLFMSQLKQAVKLALGEDRADVAIHKLSRCKVKLMRSSIGMSSMAMSLELIEASDRCETMATDGIRIFYNIDFILETKEDELIGVIVHECGHVIMEHHGRRGNRDPKLWNIATDYALNIWLIDDGYKLPEGGLIDAKYRGQKAEEIYRTLDNDDDALQDAVDQINNSKDDSDDDSGDDDSGSGNSDDSGDSDQDGSGLSGDEASAESGEESETGKYSNLPSPVGEVWDASDEDGKPLSKNDLDKLSASIMKRIAMADSTAKAMSENGSGGGLSKANKIASADIDWLEVFSDHLSNAQSDESTWNRPNRRHSWRGVHLPSKDSMPMGGTLAVAIDTSCSVYQEELDVFATELDNIARECGIEKIMVCYCDSTVHKNPNTDEWWDVYELDHEELNLNIRGGGGTRFDPAFNLYNDYTSDTDDVVAFCYFTDGEGRVSEEVEPDVPVFWLLTGDPTYYERPFGTDVMIDMSSLR